MYGNSSKVNYLKASEHLTVQENLTKAITSLSGNCVVCQEKATKTVLLVAEGNYAKMIGAPSDGRKRVSIVCICNACVEDPKYVENIKEKILNLVAPNRN